MSNSKNKTTVKFLNTLYVPKYCEELRLKNLQYEIGFCQAEIRNECRDNRYQEVLRIEQLASRLRDNWKILDGGKKEKSNKEERKEA